MFIFLQIFTEDWQRCFTEALPMYKECNKAAFLGGDVSMLFFLFQRCTDNICKSITGPVLTDCGS